MKKPDDSLARASLLFSELMPQREHEPDIENPNLVLRDDEFDIVKIMNQSKDPDTGLLRDARIDDRDLVQASNFYDYALNILRDDARPPWFMQMWTGVMLFGEVCPVCSDKRWLNVYWVADNIPKSTPGADIKNGLQLLEHGNCPKCRRSKGELIENHGLANYIELVNCLGQRSGKSSSLATYAAYQLHRLLKFPQLSSLTTAMQKSTELTGTFVGLTASRAVTIWTPFVNIIAESRWHQQYDEMLDFYGKRYGTELYRKRTEYFKYYHRGLKYYFTGPKGETLRGDTRILAAIDELGLFPVPKAEDDEATDKRANADEAHKSLSNSLATVLGVQAQLLRDGINCPPALFMGVSSPMSIRDKVMRLLRDAETPLGKKTMLAIQLPTWKVNPSIERTSPFIALAYERNYEKAERDFGANPPQIHNTWLKPSSVPYTLFTTRPTHVLRYSYDQPGALYGTVQCAYKPRYPSIVCIDAGHVNNSFALVGAHYDFEAGRVVVTTLIEVMTHDDRRIDFNLVYRHVILPILKDLNAVALIADQWQSLDILARAKQDCGTKPGSADPRCLTKQYSPRRRDFDSLLGAFQNSAIQLPAMTEAEYARTSTEFVEYKTLNHRPAEHLLLQMLTVREGAPGRSPEKGEGFTDDLFRALVLTTRIYDERVMERLRAADLYVQSERRTMPVPVFLSRA